MTNTCARQWINEQQALGHALYLIVDAESQPQARQHLRHNQVLTPYYRVYRDTPVAALAQAGPAIVLIEQPVDEHIDALLKEPERNWGWLASVAADAGFDALLRHWRARLIVGARPYQALYRFHDNRVLARALKHLEAGGIPGYLGPIISACYWHAQQWQACSNPSPGNHPVPQRPQWCEVPAEGEQSAHILALNARRYLLAEHLEAYAGIAEHQDPDLWLSNQLARAASWGWHAPEQVEFLLIQALQGTDGTGAARWQVRLGETPAGHFQRVYEETRFWQGDEQP